jgi:dTDP-4-dehydrorhamnose reductase
MTGPQNIAQITNELGTRAVFISTDYVFSGNLPVGSSYDEDHPVSPINAYGNSKAAGEVATLVLNSKNLVVRISSVFGAAGSSGKGGNFVETIVSKAKNGDPLSVVNDMYMSPTYTVDAAKIIQSALRVDVNGIIHAANTGGTTWFEFAKEILSVTNLKTQLLEAQTNWEQTPIRPQNSVLGRKKSETLVGIQPSWQDGLVRYLHEKGHVK